jgi:hypothetical protein
MKNSNDTIENRTRDLLLYVVSLNLETSGTYDGPNESSEHPYALTHTHYFYSNTIPNVRQAQHQGAFAVSAFITTTTVHVTLE